MSEEDARAWPDLMEIIEKNVRPYRDQMGGYSVAERRRTYWWQFETTAVELQTAVKGMCRCIAVCRHAPHLSLAFVPTNQTFADSLVIFAFQTNSPFAVLQSRCHEVWARFLGSSMKDDLRYSPTDCFHTFPFPENFEADTKLESIGKEYYEFRAALMVQSAKGLTKTYNRFHDPDEPSCCIARLRQLHAAMDRAVLDAYGWSDLQPVCEFLLDYTDEEDADADERPAGRGRKKPWRYRWPDDFRDTVLARLLELNKQRAQQEALAGAEDKPKKGRGKKAKRQPPESTGLF